MTREALAQASREELIELVLSVASVCKAERLRAEESEKARQALDVRLAEVEQQLAWFKRQLFGPKSERRIVEPPPSQLALGEALAPASKEDASSPAPGIPVREHVRRRGPRKGPEEPPGLRFDADVPVERIEIRDPEIEKLPPEEREEVREEVRYRLARKPDAYVVLEIVRPVVKRKDTGELVCPPAPPSVLEGSYADVSFLAGMLIDKFGFHLPLYRQHQRLEAAGIHVGRSTLTSWASRTIELLEPIYEAQFRSVVASRVLAVDETPIRAGPKGHGSRMRTAYFWPLYGDRDEVVFPYARSRARKHLEALLPAFRGTLVSDGHAAQARYAAAREQVVHALCWAHARRGFVEAERVEPERSRQALGWIRELYAVEAELREKGASPERILQARGERSLPVVEAFFGWLREELARAALLPSNPFTKAASYCLDREAGLRVFLADPEVPLDTNHLERALRVIPMGRKNWLFCWTEVGAERVGWIQSLLVTCRLHGVDPYRYLVDVLQRIDTHPQRDVAQLTPRLWKEHFAANPLPSLLDRVRG